VTLINTTNINDTCLTFIELTVKTKKSSTYDVENPGSGLEQALNMAGIHQLIGIMGSQALHRENVSQYCPKIIQN
jgi:hypothetical protein